MVTDKKYISSLSLQGLMHDPAFAEYFDDNRVFVGGVYLDSEGKPLLVFQKTEDASGQHYNSHKIPGSVLDPRRCKKVRSYIALLREELANKGYSPKERELIANREKARFLQKTIPERFITFAFLAETGLFPLEYRLEMHKTRPSIKADEKEFLQLFFRVTDVYDAALEGEEPTELVPAVFIAEREFKMKETILVPRVLNLSLAEAVVVVINNHKSVLESFNKSP